MYNNGPLIRPNPFSKRAYESYQSMRGIWHAEIWPCRKVEMSYHTLSITLKQEKQNLGKLYFLHVYFYDVTYTTNHKFGNIPIRISTLVENLDGNVPVVNGHGVVRPVMVALFSSLFYTTRQHYDGARVTLPTHSPKIVPCRMKRSLCYYKFPW